MGESEQDVLHPLSGEVVDTLVDNRRRFVTFLARRVENHSDAEEILQSA